ncbi:MAG: protein kinase [Synechococcaceae cyanobacterium SM2_3_2]|nr:protein kinase [Synechococcaceae cyanobacterium SM2_3_2]
MKLATYCLNPACPQPKNLAEVLQCQTCGNGLLIRNRYRPFKKIGQGGFGATFLAQDQDLPSKPWRVIKQLRPVEDSPQVAALSLELFNREAEVLEKLGEHSQIPKLYAHFEENEKYYLVQEYIQGITLSQEMAVNKAPMNEAQVRQVMQEMLLILSYVHSNNTVHRDIKPANIIRRKTDQRLVLIDFGAVKQLSPGQEPTVEATAIRSLGYSPPEQTAGQAVVPASDIYALGATCLNLLSMQSPAKFFDNDRARWNWDQQIQVSPELNQVLTKMLQPAVLMRFATATEVLRALQGLDSGPSVNNGSGASSATTPPLISNHWSARRSEGFSPPGGDSTAPRPQTSGPVPNPLATGRMTKGGFNPTSFGTVGTGPTGFGQHTTGFSRPQATPPRVASLAGTDLRDRNFARQNLAGQDLRKADIRGVDFSGANLQRADLRGVVFNVSPPLWIRILAWMLAQAKTISGILVGFGALVGSAAGAFLIARLLLGDILVSLGAGVLGMILVGTWLWSITGQNSFRRHSEETSKQFTSFHKADLRGAQMDDNLRRNAARQGATLG